MAGTSLNLNRFSKKNSFTDGKSRKFPTKTMYHFPPHVKHVASRNKIYNYIRQLRNVYMCIFNTNFCIMEISSSQTAAPLCFSSSVIFLLVDACVGLNWLLVSFLSHVNKNIIHLFTNGLSGLQRNGSDSKQGLHNTVMALSTYQLQYTAISSTYQRAE